MVKCAKEPDWSESKTLPTEMWKNRLFSLADRLLIADGAVAFEREVNANLRSQLKELEKCIELR